MAGKSEQEQRAEEEARLAEENEKAANAVQGDNVISNPTAQGQGGVVTRRRGEAQNIASERGYYRDRGGKLRTVGAGQPIPEGWELEENPSESGTDAEQAAKTEAVSRRSRGGRS